MRDDLAKLGFTPRQEQLKEVLAHGHQSPAEDFRAVRPMRSTRLTHLTRLAPVQRIAQVVEDVRRWLGLDQKKVESVKQAEKISPAVRETPGQKLRRVLEQNQQQQQRRSRGMSI